MPGRARPQILVVPAGAATVALGYLLAAWWAPEAMVPVVVAAVTAAAALGVRRGATRARTRAIAAIAAWLAAAMALAWSMRDRPVAALAVLVVGMFAAPLPLVPWLYAASFPADHAPPATGHDRRGAP